MINKNIVVIFINQNFLTQELLQNHFGEIYQLVDQPYP